MASPIGVCFENPAMRLEHNQHRGAPKRLVLRVVNGVLKGATLGEGEVHRFISTHVFSHCDRLGGLRPDVERLS